MVKFCCDAGSAVVVMEDKPGALKQRSEKGLECHLLQFGCHSPHTSPLPTT